MIRIAHRLPLVCTIALAATCLGTALPAHAGASLEVGYFDDGDWVPLSGTASGVMRICVKYTPPPPPPQRTVVGVSLQQIRVTDKRGQHTIPVEFDAGVPLPGGKAVAYLWRSFLDTNGPISIEADGTASTFAPPPVGSGTVSFTVSCSCESENLTVADLANSSDLAQWGLVAFSPDSATHWVTATLADAPDPHGPASDVGNVSVGLANIGPDGLGSLAWGASWPSEQLGQGGEYTGSLVSPPNIPLIYAPTAGALEVDEDSHSWYSPYVSVQLLPVSRSGVTAARCMSIRVPHVNSVPADLIGPSALSALVVSMAPMAQVGCEPQSLDCGPGPREDLLNVGPCDAAGVYRLFVTGMDGHGSKSKYAGNVEQPIAPAAVEMVIPSASCIAGEENGGGAYELAQASAQARYASLGAVACPSDPSQSCFYSSRYVYGQGWRGGYQDRPGWEHTLEMLFEDVVVTYNGHGAPDMIQNQRWHEVTDANIADYAQQHGESDAQFVFLQTCLAGQYVGPALASAGVDCVVAFRYRTNITWPCWSTFMHKICSEEKSILQAYTEMAADPYWQAGQPWISGNTYLWGMPI